MNNLPGGLLLESEAVAGLLDCFGLFFPETPLFRFES
jgi:hypothetical protein